MSAKGFVGTVGSIIGVFILLIGFMMFTERVPEGKVAVVYSPSGGAKEVLSPGWHTIGLFEKTTQYPTRIQVVKSKVSVSTNDGKKVAMSARYEVKVDKSKVLKIFKELGSQNIEEIQEGYLYTKLFKASRETISSYSLLDVYGTKTTEASAKITKDFGEKVAPLGFIVSDVTLGTPEADAQTQKAIDSRVQASQETEKLKIQLENEKIVAQKKQVVAEGDAQQAIIKAQGDAKANKILSNSLTDKVLKAQELEARKKFGWVTVQGAGSVIVDK